MFTTTKPFETTTLYKGLSTQAQKEKTNMTNIEKYYNFIQKLEAEREELEKTTSKLDDWAYDNPDNLPEELRQNIMDFCGDFSQLYFKLHRLEFALGLEKTK